MGIEPKPFVVLTGDGFQHYRPNENYKYVGNNHYDVIPDDAWGNRTPDPWRGNGFQDRFLDQPDIHQWNSPFPSFVLNSRANTIIPKHFPKIL